MKAVVRELNKLHSEMNKIKEKLSKKYRDVSVFYSCGEVTVLVGDLPYGCEYREPGIRVSCSAATKRVAFELLEDVMKELKL